MKKWEKAGMYLLENPGARQCDAAAILGLKKQIVKYADLKIKKGWKPENDDAIFYNKPERRCFFCGTEESLCKHHTVPRHWGGTEDFMNIMDVCENCHRKIHNYLNKLEHIMAMQFKVWLKNIQYKE